MNLRYCRLVTVFALGVIIGSAATAGLAALWGDATDGSAQLSRNTGHSPDEVGEPVGLTLAEVNTIHEKLAKACVTPGLFLEFEGMLGRSYSSAFEKKNRRWSKSDRAASWTIYYRQEGPDRIENELIATFHLDPTREHTGFIGMELPHRVVRLYYQLADTRMTLDQPIFGSSVGPDFEEMTVAEWLRQVK